MRRSVGNMESRNGAGPSCAVPDETDGVFVSVRGDSFGDEPSASEVLVTVGRNSLSPPGDPPSSSFIGIEDSIPTKRSRSSVISIFSFIAD